MLREIVCGNQGQFCGWELGFGQQKWHRTFLARDREAGGGNIFHFAAEAGIRNKWKWI